MAVVPIRHHPISADAALSQTLTKMRCPYCFDPSIEELVRLDIDSGQRIVLFRDPTDPERAQIDSFNVSAGTSMTMGDADGKEIGSWESGPSASVTMTNDVTFQVWLDSEQPDMTAAYETLMAETGRSEDELRAEDSKAMREAIQRYKDMVSEARDAEARGIPLDPNGKLDHLASVSRFAQGIVIRCGKATR